MTTTSDEARERDQEQLRALLLEAPAAIAVLRGRDLRIELLNPVAQKLLGVRGEVGKPLGEAAPELAAQGIVDIALRVLETGVAFRAAELTAAFAQKDGSTQDATFSAVMIPLRDARGDIDGVMALGFEVTAQVNARKLEVIARERAERAVRMLTTLHAVTTSLARTLTAAEAAEVIIDEGVKIIAADTGTLYLQREDQLVLLRHRGIGTDIVESMRVLPITADVPGARVARTGEACWASNFEEYLAQAPQIANRHFSGPRVRAFACLPLVVDGRSYGVMAFGFYADHVFTDEERATLQTLARQCAQALERARLYEREQQTSSQLRLLAEASAVLQSSLDYGVTLANLAKILVPHHADWCAIDVKEEGDEIPKLVTIAHADPAKVKLGYELRRMHPPRADDTSGVVNVFNTGKPELYSHITEDILRATARDERELAVALELGMRSAMCIPLRSHGVTLGTITIVSTTEGRYYTEDDARLMLDLAGRAALAVSHARLHREAREAVRIRDEFLSIASHELNTPLTSLRLIVESLRRGRGGPDKIPARLESAERQVTRLTNLVGDLLDVSRIVGGGLKLTAEAVDLGVLVRDVTSRFTDPPGVIDLRVADGVVGQWDPVRLEQVVMNLVSNAVKYGGGKPIDVIVESLGTYARLTVRDRGIGIAPENQARIFQRFERAVSSRHYGGFGLGLWIAREAIEASGGVIRVESAPGRGSTFTVELPLTAPPPAS